MYHTNLTQFLDDTVHKHPERTAVIDEEISLSFTELRDLSLKLSSLIAETIGKKKNQIVAVYIPKSRETVIANIAVNYSGNAYMNLDMKHPAGRIKNIFEAIHPSLIISREDVVGRILPLVGKIPVICVDEIKLLPKINKSREYELLERRDSCLDTDPLCIINTSGSTGTPKGVALHHRSFIDLIESEVRAGLLDEEHEVVASLSPIVFDVYNFEVCLMMMRGATLVLVPERFSAFPARLLEYISGHDITFLYWGPTIMVNIANLDLLSRISLPYLRKVWWIGEVLPTIKFNYWQRHLHRATFVNLYGPAEIAQVCTYFVVNKHIPDDQPIPIGKALPNTEVFLLDSEGKRAKQGEEGEICVRGICLALGYYNNLEKTRLSFVSNPLNQNYPEIIYKTGDIGVLDEDGNIIFKGRRDTMIKHLDYRIELAEVENVILGTVEKIKNCCAVYNEKTKKIVLFYESEAKLEDRELRLGISSVLPRYMVPHEYRFMPSLPINTNGKIDRLILREQAMS